jgi:flagellar basal-body rod modification protein FlgD
MAESLLVGAVNDGAYKKTAASQEATKSNSTTSTSKTAESKGTQYNQEMFLQLLVAEMQYQDPLEPTDNGQYVAQLASFTQIEAIQSVQNDMATIEANSLVGKYVVINDNNKEVRGKVNFVSQDDDGTMYVNVNEKNYKVDDIESVVDETYYGAVVMIEAFNDAYNKLPTLENVTLGNEKEITEAVTIFNSMDNYTQGFLKDEVKENLTKIAARFDELAKAREEAKKAKEAAEAEAKKEAETTTEETTANPAVEATEETKITDDKEQETTVEEV